MAASQKFCLKWNNFQNSVTSVFENLRQDEELVDITLCCEGQKIKAHRMMLSACSPYFRDLLKENPCQHPVFFLKDTSYPDLAAVVEFVYKGEVNVLQSQLGSFLKTAEMLQVKGLSGDDDDDQPGRPLPHTVEPRPRLNSVQPPGSSPLRNRAPREPPDAPQSPHPKRRRMSGGGGGGSRPTSPVPVQMTPAAPPLPPGPTHLETGGESSAPAASPVTSAMGSEPVLDHRPSLLQQHPGPPTLAPPPPPPPPPPSHHGAVTSAHHDDYIKVEKIDIADDEDDDESLEATLGQVSSFEATHFEGSDHSASSQDMAGLLSRVSEQGGSGDMSMAGTAGTSEDGSSQGCPRGFVRSHVPGASSLLLVLSWSNHSYLVQRARVGRLAAVAVDTAVVVRRPRLQNPLQTVRQRLHAGLVLAARGLAPRPHHVSSLSGGVRHAVRPATTHDSAAPGARGSLELAAGRRRVPPGRRAAHGRPPRWLAQYHAFRCATCGRAFGSQRTLTRHEELHRGLTTCPHCLHVFSCKMALRTHMKTICREPQPQDPCATPPQSRPSSQAQYPPPPQSRPSSQAQYPPPPQSRPSPQAQYTPPPQTRPSPQAQPQAEFRDAP